MLLPSVRRSASYRIRGLELVGDGIYQHGHHWEGSGDATLPQSTSYPITRDTKQPPVAPIGHRHWTSALATLEKCPIYLGHEQVYDAAPVD
jgi:hypothetical protein